MTSPTGKDEDAGEGLAEGVEERDAKCRMVSKRKRGDRSSTSAGAPAGSRSLRRPLASYAWLSLPLQKSLRASAACEEMSDELLVLPVEDHAAPFAAVAPSQARPNTPWYISKSANSPSSETSAS
jgi:hypothetical protein